MEIKKKEYEYVQEHCLQLDYNKYPGYTKWVYSTRKDIEKQAQKKRIFVISKYYLVFIKTSMMGSLKLDMNVHFYDIKELGLIGRDVVVLKINNPKKDSPIIVELQVPKGSEEDADELIHSIQLQYRKSTINFSSISTYLLNVPQQRLSPLPEWTEEELTTGVASMGGVCEVYKATCFHQGRKYNLDFLSWIDDLMAEKSTILDFDDCPGMDKESEMRLELGPVLKALSFNSHFTEIRMRGVNEKELMKTLAYVLQRNTTVTKLHISKLDIEREGIAQVMEAIKMNHNTNIKDIHISDCRFELVDAQSFATFFESTDKIIENLEISCDLSGDSLSTLLLGLRKGKFSEKIKKLALPKNKIDQNVSEVFCGWLQPLSTQEGFSLVHIDLSNTGFYIDKLLPILPNLTKIEYLDISASKINYTKDLAVTKEEYIKKCVQYLLNFLANNNNIKHLGLAQCELVNDTYIPFIIKQAGSNSKLNGLKTIISGNVLRGSDKFSDAIIACKTSQSLDLSKNKFSTVATISLAQSIVLNRTTNNNTYVLNEFILDNMFSSKKKDNQIPIIASALASTFNSPQTIRELSMKEVGNKMMLTILENLSPSCTILKMDLSNNQLGDRGAFLLAQFLKKNPKLEYLSCDNNNFTFTGYKSIHRVIRKHNSNLIHFSHAWKDYYSALSLYAKDEELEKRMRNIIIGIQDKVAMNRMNKLMRGPLNKSLDLNTSMPTISLSNFNKPIERHSSTNQMVIKSNIEVPKFTEVTNNNIDSDDETAPENSDSLQTPEVPRETPNQPEGFFTGVDNQQLDDEIDMNSLTQESTNTLSVNTNPFINNN
eukprot:TRINITY_DN4192_c0_g1_i1.p1 TRINITY_DN4192_c0_g1~~TRINITY_DN4192_c0_g1_i1.p1  ORF type:complete len:827 (+),score=311.36 TRINITY_DN4192_c0_g1_i1:20-2500(+)